MPKTDSDEWAKETSEQTSMPLPPLPVAGDLQHTAAEWVEVEPGWDWGWSHFRNVGVGDAKICACPEHRSY
jgi:hypothetical protein